MIHPAGLHEVKRCARTGFLPLMMAALFFLTVPGSVGLSQTNPDWDVLWQHHPDTTHLHPYFWMGVRPFNFTGLAYDKFRDLVYVVNPDICIGQFGIPYGCPKIHIWKATTGLIDSSVGRSLTGAGGMLPTPIDTILGGYERGRFCAFKIDLDDEGRIYACNLVSPIWNPPDPPCPPDPTNQGPWKVYRWDTPTSSPKCIYATLNATHDSIGWSRYNTEMTFSRWGDAFDVVGKRAYRYAGPSLPPILADSVRIFASGGAHCSQTETNREVNIFLRDERPSAPFEFRQAVRLVSSLEGIASHGIAVTGASPTSEIWMDNNGRVTTLNNQYQTQDPWPQVHAMTSQFALSGDSLTGTGPSGPIAYFRIIEANRSYLICADGTPTDRFDTSRPNHNTTARIVDVSNPNQAYRHMSVTPRVGLRPQDYLDEFDGNNYIADVDYKLEVDPLHRGYYITLFVLMSNNGIAAYRSKSPFIIPVEMMSFEAVAGLRDVRLRWVVASETNNHGFEIERSFNLGNSWERIGFAEGRGTSYANKEYRYDDPLTTTHRSVGEVQYRLRQIDFDGTANYSSTASVFLHAPASLQLAQNYPNPFHASTSIGYSLPSEAHVLLIVYNTVGEAVRVLVDEDQSAGAHASEFVPGTLPPGVYVYQLEANGQKVQKRLVLRR